MPAPLDVQYAGSGSDVAAIDSAGNLTVSGWAQVGKYVALKAGAAPVQIPGELLLYTPDGSALTAVAPSGAVALVSFGSAYAPVPLAQNTVTGTVAATLLASGMTVPAGALAVGEIINFRAWGVLSTTVNTQTFTLALDWGGIAGTVVVSSGAQNPNNSGAVTNQSWWIEGSIQCTAANTLTAMLYDHMSFLSFSEASASGVAVPTATANQLVLSVTPSAAAASITVTGGYFQRIN